MEARLTAIEKKLDTLIALMNQRKSPITSKSGKSTKSRAKTEQVIKSGSAKIMIYNDIILVTGNTYSNKSHIKSVGAKWDKDNKGWKVSLDNKEELQEIVVKYFETSAYKTMNTDLQITNDSDETTHNSAIVNEECEIFSDSD